MKIKFLVFLLFSLFLIVPRTIYAAQKPLRANIFLSWNITDAQAIQLSKWDLLVLDAEVGALQPKLLKKIRARNPRIKILAYISAVELQKNETGLAKHAPLRAALRARTPESTYVHRPDGTAVSFWPTANLINTTSAWQKILPQFIQEKILATKLWDGIMLDNTWNGVSWYVGATDLDNNQIEDAPEIANAAWNSGLHSIISRLKKQSPRAIIIGNGSEIYSELDGIVIENFGQKNLYETLARAQSFAKDPKKLVIFNSTAENLDEPSREQMLFGLGSSLLFDAYFSYDMGDTNHASLWWFPEYDTQLGAARGRAAELAPNVWKREFSGGTVLVNAGSTTTTFSNIVLAPHTSKITIRK